MDQRRAAILVSAALLLAGCAAAGFSPSPTPTMEETPPPRSALELLDCDGEPSGMGGFADDFGPDGFGSTPDEAFFAWMTSNPFTVPRSGYERIGAVSDGAVYAYDVGGEVKVVVVVSSRFGELVDAEYTIEELRTCDPAEFGAEADFGPGRVWANAEGLILTDIVAPAHCGWETARMLHVPDGDSFRQYIRDPLGVMGQAGLLESYNGDVDLPTDALDSGYRSGGLELWFTPADIAAYIVGPDIVERWPRADPPAGCA